MKRYTKCAEWTTYICFSCWINISIHWKGTTKNNYLPDIFGEIGIQLNSLLNIEILHNNKIQLGL